MTKKLLDNGMVEETIVKTIPRYVGFEKFAEWACEDITNNFTSNNKIWITPHEREGFKGVYDTGIGIGIVKDLDCHNYDNGVYYIDDDFNIVKHTSGAELE